MNPKNLTRCLIALMAMTAHLAWAGNTITYTTRNGKIVTPYSPTAFGGNIVSNDYADGVGTLTFDGEVTSIGPRAFYYCKSLTSITIPSGVTSIGFSAFESCTSLTSVDIPSGVTNIYEKAFQQCTSLTDITLPEGLTALYASFDGCISLPSITIPSTVTTIGEYTFRSCKSLTSLTIPASVTQIAEDFCSNCPMLTSIVVESGNCKYDSRGNCNAVIETATNTLIAGCCKTVIPSSVTSIGGFAFRSCSSLTSITIPSSVTSIGYEAFNTSI